MFKCIREVVLCEGVQHHLQFCLERLSCVKITVFSIGEKEKLQGAKAVGEGDNSHVVFDKKFHCEKWCIVMMQQPVVFSLKFGAKSLHIFTPLS
jgi:hypothetical protein